MSVKEKESKEPEVVGKKMKMPPFNFELRGETKQVVKDSKIMPRETSSVGSVDMQNLFGFVNQARFNYVVLENWHSLPMSHNIKDPVTVLVENAEAFRRLVHGIWEAPVLGHDLYMTVNDAGGKPAFRFRCIQKGAGFMPESYESSMMARRRLHNNCVYVCDDEHEALCALYRCLYYGQDMSKAIIRRSVEAWVNKTVGGQPIFQNSAERFGYKLPF